MLTKAYKISKIIASVVILAGVLAIIIACIIVYRRSKKTKGYLLVNFMMTSILVNPLKKNLIF